MSILRLALLLMLTVQVSCLSNNNPIVDELNQKAVTGICELDRSAPWEGGAVWVSGHYIVNFTDPPTLNSWMCPDYFVFVTRGDVEDSRYEDLMYHVNLHTDITGDVNARLPIIFYGTLNRVPGGDKYILRYDDFIIVN